MPSLIAHSRPFLGLEEEEAVKQVLQSGQLAQGPNVERFEQDMATFLGVRGGVAVSSGTAALHLALLALDVKSGDEVLMPSYVCRAPLIATQRIGAIPRIIDIEPETYGLDPVETQKAISSKSKAIIVPHMFGLPANVAALRDLGVPIIEDCAQTLQATQNSKAVGQRGTLTICSFYANKLLCTGEGGMVLSNDLELLSKARTLREYDQQTHYNSLSFNYKMTDIQGALGLCQLKRLPRMLARRSLIASKYSMAFRYLPVGLPVIPRGRTHIFYRFVLSVPPPLDSLIQRLENRGVQCRRPVFLPLHQDLGLPGFPRTKTAFESVLSIPIHPSLRNEEVEFIIQAFQEELR